MTAAFLAPAVWGNETAMAGISFSRARTVTPRNHQMTAGLRPVLEDVPGGFLTARATYVYLTQAAVKAHVDRAQRRLGQDQAFARRVVRSLGRWTTSALDRELNGLTRGTETRRGWWEKMRDWIHQKLWRSPVRGAVSTKGVTEALEKFTDGPSRWALLSGKDTTNGQWKWFTVVKVGGQDGIPTHVLVQPAQGDQRWFFLDSKELVKHLSTMGKLASVKLTPYKLLPKEGEAAWQEVIVYSLSPQKQNRIRV